MNERPIPKEALADEYAVEMLRVWIANKKLHSSIKVGMYAESTNIPEERAWGRILADVARHVANALEEGYSADGVRSLNEIRNAFNRQLDAPDTDVHGKFLGRNRAP